MKIASKVACIWRHTDGNRTHNLGIASVMLYRLSYKAKGNVLAANQTLVNFLEGS